MDKDLTISDAFPPWLTHTKILPIRQHISLIVRTELCRMLNSGLDQKAALLAAPAGFGKSTLLSQWREDLLRKEILVAWVNIDENDNDPSIFALYLAYSLAESGLAQDIHDLHPNGFDQETSPRTILGILQSAIAKQNTKIVIILDGVEKLNESVLKVTLDPLLQYSPANLQVVLSTRTAKKLQISSLKLQGQVNQISASEFKFTAFEMEEFLGGNLDKRTLQTVSKKTENWPVALQLLKNSLSGHSDHSKIIAKFNGGNPDAREYIFEHILSQLPEHQRDLLLEVSILEKFDPITADLIREADNSRNTLKELEALDIVIKPLPVEEQLYQLHPILQETFIYFLEQSSPERMKKLHLNAANMFRDQGDFIQSIGHALRANETERAAEILEKAGGILLWNKEGMARIRKAHALLPDHIINTRPRLSLLNALVLLKDGHINEARNIYNKVQQELENSDQPHSVELDYDFAVITSTLAVYEGTPLTQEMNDRIVSAIERIESTEALQVGFVFTILCVFNLQKGDYPKARQVGKKAIAQYQRHHSIFGETYIYTHLGVVATAEGKLDEAYEYYKKAQDNLRQYFSEDKDLRLVINILMAEWHYEKNELNSAVRLLGDINHRLETGEAWYEIYAAGYSTSTALAYLQKGLSVCLNLSSDSVAYIKREGLKRLNRLVMANKVGYLCRAGKITNARNIVQENNLTFQDYNRENGIHFSVRECYGVTQALARLLIAEKRYQEAITELRCQIKNHHPAHETRASQKYRLLLAIALFENKQEKSAFQELEEVLIFIRTNGFLRFTLDEAPFITPLLEAYVKSDAAAENDHGKYLLNQLREIKLPQDQIILSRREKQVLDQLAEGYSDKIIARNLDVTENTVRFHLKNLFSKLDVNSRLMAVSEAAKHKLLK